MSRSERIVRIFVSLALLALSKSVALASPLFFRSLIETDLNLKSVTNFIFNLKISILGLVLGLGISKVSACFIHFISEMILAPATTSAAEILPSEAFRESLMISSRRSDGQEQFKLFKKNPSTSSKTVLDATPSSSGPSGATRDETESHSGFARRALDRGLRASNQLLYRAIFNLLPSFIESICVLCLLCAKTGISVGITAGVVAYGFVLLSGFSMSRRLPILREALQAESYANSCAEDALSLAETVISFGNCPLEQQRYDNALREVTRTSLKVRSTFSLLKLMQGCLLGAGFSAVTYAAITSATTSAKAGSVAGRLVLVQALFSQLCAPLDQVGQHLRDCLSAAEDLRELEALKVLGRRLRRQHTVPVESSGASSARPEIPLALVEDRIERDLSSPIASSNPLLEVKDLYFSYSVTNTSTPAVPLLKGISFTIPSPGYAIGIVGPSGSGKSTLLRLLLGLEDVIPALGNRGVILHEGCDISRVGRSSLFSTVTQDSDLFGSLSLRDNVRYGCSKLVVPTDLDESAIAEAVIDAELGPVLRRLPGHWMARVGPRGRLLSGGERQRVCLARALYRQRVSGGILLVDEGTASLDAQTEAAVVKALQRRVQSGATAVIVSHRLSSVVSCDEILVLVDGNVIERGTHEDLVRASGWYSRSWQLQKQGRLDI